MRLRLVFGLLLGSVSLFAWTFAAEIRIKADDLLRFDVRKVTVRSGETVVVTLENVGQLQNHAHNFVLLKPGADMGKFSTSNTDPQKAKALLQQLSIAFTPMVPAGGRESVTFKAPAPGTYTYICSYPGHQSKSRGSFVVQ